MPTATNQFSVTLPYGPGWNSQTHSYDPLPSTGGSAGTATSPLTAYNSNPSPKLQGQGPYGAVPGNIGIPPSTWQQTIGVAPGLGNTSQLTKNIMSELQGDINPQALKNMQDAAASYGVSSGMPGSNAIPGTLAFNKNLRNIGLDTMAVQRQGQQDYLSALQGIGGAQTPQALAAEIAAHNAQLNAAPDPAQAAQQQLANYWNALNAIRGPGGGTGQGTGPQGGTGALAPQVPGLPSAPQQFGGAFPNYGSDFSYQTPGGSSLTWAGGAPLDLFGDLGSAFGGAGAAPTPSFGAPPNTAYNPSTNQSVFDPYGGYYDQTASPDFGGDMSNEDYFYNVLGGY